MKKFWEERYGEKDYIYGVSPNVFFEEQLSSLPCGKILLPCEGEGRNAVHSARSGWDVFAFDASVNGKIKAMNLAKANDVSIEYQVDDALIIEYPIGHFDVVALIYAHFPPNNRKILHQKVMQWLKPGGTIIIEAFSPLQIVNTSGGPKDPTMLYSREILTDDFKDFNIVQNELCETYLKEGKYHDGKADIIRFVAKKNN